MARKTVVIGFLGTTLDFHGGYGQNRWNAWRPTVALGMQEDLLVDRLELLHGSDHEKLAQHIVKDFSQVSPETEIRRHIFDLTNPWDFEEVYAALYDFAESYPFDTDSEDYLIHISTGTHVLQICLFLLTESRHLPARLIQTGITQKENDPAGIYAIIDLNLSRYEKLAERFRRKTKFDMSFLKSGIETRNAAFNTMIAQMEQVGAESREPILLMGPTGSGKSRLAGLIYELRKQRHLVQGDFVTVNCATLRGDMAMSTLFGHRKGSFSGAEADRTGLLRQADGGLLFLDEVGELGLDEQAMLLRAIEEKRFYPLGADTESCSDFQLICGTNRVLEHQAAEGKFREDLLARINTWTFHLPGLAQRPEDIEPNLEYEIEQVSAKIGRRIRFNKEARELFLSLAKRKDALWRGNFRDLSAAVLRLGVLAGGSRVSTALVREEWERLTRSWISLSGKTEDQHSGDDMDLLHAFMGEEVDALDLFDVPQLAFVIRFCQKCGTLSEAGRALFASSRKTKQNPNDADRLRKYLARYNLSWDIIHKR